MVIDTSNLVVSGNHKYNGNKEQQVTVRGGQAQASSPEMENMADL